MERCKHCKRYLKKNGFAASGRRQWKSCPCEGDRLAKMNAAALGRWDGEHGLPPHGEGRFASKKQFASYRAAYEEASR